jgi:hypothetical protein
MLAELATPETMETLSLQLRHRTRPTPHKAGGTLMGFLDKVKKLFDAGGIKTELFAPDSFRWSDESIPLRVRVTGHESDVRTIKAFSFKLEEDVSGSADERERRNRTRYTFETDDVVTLQPGESQEIEVAFPLSMRGLQGDSTAAKAGRFLAAAADVIGSGGLTIGSRGSRWRITVTTEVEGANVRKGTSRQIRALGMGEFVTGNASLLD